MNHTPKEYEILISDDLLARIMHCDLQSGTSEKCSGCKYNNTSDCAGEVDRTHVSHDLVVARSVILRLEKERAIMLEALIDAYKIIRQHENPDLPGSAELRAIKMLIERATGRKIEEVIK